MWRRLIYKIHKILGTLLSVLFLMWFVSGIVLIYHGFPRVTENDRMAHYNALPDGLPALDSVFVKIPDPERMEKLNLINCRGVEQFVAVKGGAKFIIPCVGDKTELPVSRDGIMDVAQSWCGEAIVRIDTLFNLEQWIPWGQLRSQFPIYKFSFADSLKTQLYISSQSQDVIQCTNVKQRFWAWMGAIPHWVYFTRLRQDLDLWKKVVIGLSGLGVVMVLAGVFVGIDIYRKGWKRSGRIASPYRKKWYYWHHVTGILFGIFVLTWVFSGMMSLASLPACVGKEKQKYPVKAMLNSKQLAFNEYPLDYRDVIRHYQGKVKKIEWNCFYDIPTYVVSFDNECVVIDATKTGTIQELNLDKSEILKPLELIHAGETFSQVELMNAYDSYYISKQGRLPLPVWKVEVNNADNTCYYINPKTGDIQDYNTRKRWNFWVYSGFHSLLIKGVVTRPILWTIVMWGLLLGGAVVSLSGIVLGINYLRRLLQRRISKH